MRHMLGYCLKSFTIASLFAASLLQAQQSVTKINPQDLVTNGESFFEASNITSELTRLARRDGFISQNESFRTVSKSGQPISVIIQQYKNCNPKPKYLISDGAGIDLMSGNCSDVNCSKIQDCANKLKDYLEEMRKGGTKKLLWMIYPDPQPPMGSATLKTNQDLWAEVVPPILNACEDPKPLIVDLRETWAGHYSQYTQDGIHCTQAGGTATAEAFWEAMIENNFFDLETPVTEPLTIATVAPSAVLSRVVGNGIVAVSFSAGQPTNVALRLTTVSGRSVFTARRQASVSGMQTVEFPVGMVAPGLYCSEVRVGNLTSQSTLMVP